MGSFFGDIGSMIGIGGGSGGLNYRSPQADLMTGATTEQANQALGTANSGLAQQQAFLNALQAQNGIGNQSQVFQQQQALAGQLQAASLGQGPNPAQMQLNQATGQNVANQAALMGSQRGAGANAGLLARQAAMQGGAIQQNAAGQAATMQAQQQIAARQQLQNQQGMMAGVAGQQVGQQGNALTGYNQFAQNEQGQLLNSIAQHNATSAGLQANANTVNAGMNQASAHAQGQLLGGLFGATGIGAQQVGNAGGGLGGGASSAPQMTNTFKPYEAHGGMIMNNYAQGGQVQGNHYKDFFSNWSPGAVAMATGGQVQMQVGGSVPGTPAVNTHQDTYANDTVDAKLSPGEVVIPRSIMTGKDPAAAAAKFVQAILAKQGMKKNG